jgi:23S rRNA pseudouridine2604 synthase
MSEPIRLAKRLAQDLACSRSQAEQYIEGGWVSVDGVLVEDPASRVAPEQSVQLAQNALAQELPPVTILLHKPAGLALAEVGGGFAELSRLLDAENRAASDNSGMRQLRKHRKGLKLGAGLDARTSGVVVLSQDWRVLRRLTEDARRIEQEYIVEVDQDLSAPLLVLVEREAVARRLAGKISRQSEKRLRFAMKASGSAAMGQGIGQEIALACEAAGLRALELRRIRIGRIALAGVAPGQWRYLREDEFF